MHSISFYKLYDIIWWGKYVYELRYLTFLLVNWEFVKCWYIICRYNTFFNVGNLGAVYFLLIGPLANSSLLKKEKMLFLFFLFYNDILNVDVCKINIHINIHHLTLTLPPPTTTSTSFPSSVLTPTALPVGAHPTALPADYLLVVVSFFPSIFTSLDDSDL